MRTLLLFSTLALAVALSACGGNVSVSTGGAGSGSGGSGGSTATTTSTTTSGSTTPPDDFYSCDGPGQCVLATPGCCPGCGVPELGAFVAVNSAKTDAYFKFVCPEPTPCPECVSQPNPNLFAYCQAGKCVAADVRSDPVSQCKTDADCHLRNGSSCCETCGVDPSNVVAVSSQAPQPIETLVCPPDAGCPKCAAQYPDGWFAVCGEAGHCSIDGVPPNP